MNEELLLNEAWIIELHPKGGSRSRMARDVMSDNLAAYAKGEKPEWVPVAITHDFPTAQKKLAAIRRDLRSEGK